MKPYKSVPPRPVTDNQLLQFRADLAHWMAGITAAATDEAPLEGVTFKMQCAGCSADLRAKAAKLVEYLGRIGDHRLSRGHRQSAAALRAFLAMQPFDNPDAPDNDVLAWQADVLALVRALRAAGEAERASRGGKRGAALVVAAEA